MVEFQQKCKKMVANWFYNFL